MISQRVKMFMPKWNSFATISLAVAAAACGSGPQRYLDKGNGLFSAGRFAEADLNYQKALQKDPSFAEAYYRLGLAEFQEGKLPLSIAHLAHASSLLPSREEVAVAWADSSFAGYLVNRGDANLYNQVETISQRLLEKNPNSYDGLRLKGYVSMLDRHFPEAIETLKKANAVKPMQPELIEALTQCLIAAGQAAEAETLATDLIHRQPAGGRIYDILYEHYMSAKRPADGEAILKKKIENNPNNLNYRLQLAGYFATVNDDAGLAQAVRAVTDDPSRFPGAFLEAGNLYFSLGRYDDALHVFQAGAKRENRERKWACRKRAVDVLIAQKKWDQATAAVQEMLQSSAGNVEARALRVEIALDRGQPESAAAVIPELRNLIQLNAKDPVLHFNLGRAYVAGGDTDSALAEFNQASQLSPRYLQPLLLAANLSLERQDYKQANQYAAAILNLTGDNPAAKLIGAASLTGMGDFTGAARELNQLSRQFPNSPVLKFQRGDLMRAQKNYKEAENIFRSLYESDRKDLVPLRSLVATWYEQGKYDAAVQYLTQETHRANSEEIRSLLAEAALRGKKLDLAIQQYSQLAAAQPESAMAHLRLGDAYLQEGKVDDAVGQFETARKLAPKDALVNAMLALSFHNSGRAADAEKAYRDTLALQSNNPQVKNNLAYLMAETGGNLDEALRLAQEASHANPGEMAFSDTVGWIYFKKKNTDSAIQVLTNVVEKDPRDAVFHYHLAAALLDKGERAEARKQLQAALDNRPSKNYTAKIRDLMSKVSN